MTDLSSTFVHSAPADDWLADIHFDENGLIPAIAQDACSGTVLMVAWMNRAALQASVRSGQAVYFSRSRQKLWHKGEESGHTQQLHEIRLDCDGDVILLKVRQTGGIACHTGRNSCFYRRLEAHADELQWQACEPVLQDPATIYKKADPHES